MKLFKKEKLKKGVTITVTVTEGKCSETYALEEDILTNKQIRMLNSLKPTTFSLAEVKEPVIEKPTMSQVADATRKTFSKEDEKFLREMIERIEKDEATIAEAMKALKSDSEVRTAADISSEIIGKIKKSAENITDSEKKSIFAENN